MQARILPNYKMNTFLRSVQPGLLDGADDIERTIIREYGAVFVAAGGSVPPDRIIFADEPDVHRFQSNLATQAADVGGVRLELQKPAMLALLTACEQAAAEGLRISPRGVDSAKRSYGQTLDLWASRVEPALSHWTATGKLSNAEADEIRSLDPFSQVARVFECENQGMFFAKSLDKPIMYSVAPPGTSQHLSMLALDVAEFQDQRVREILADNGWFQTVISDLPHFTYLGSPQADLPALGLKRIDSAHGQVFWVPDI
jgi:hypothetical protein